eukprot:Colp12_sorted_trinity150504_noHs@30333
MARLRQSKGLLFLMAVLVFAALAIIKVAYQNNKLAQENFYFASQQEKSAQKEEAAKQDPIYITVTETETELGGRARTVTTTELEYKTETIERTVTNEIVGNAPTTATVTVRETETVTGTLGGVTFTETVTVQAASQAEPQNPFPQWKWWPKFVETMQNTSVLTEGKFPSKEKVLELYEELSEFITTLPSGEPKSTRREPPLSYDCGNSAYSSILTGRKRSSPVRIVWSFLFSAEVQLLEINLHELDDVVDIFILHESTVTHRGARKPLYYDRASAQFRKFHHKLVHNVYDDSRVGWIDHVKADLITDRVDWTLDAQQHQLGLRYLREHFAWLSDDDIIIWGDGDEVADPGLLLHMKHCEITTHDIFPLATNTPFYMSDFRWLFQTDWPPSYNYPYSFAMPTLWSYRTLKELSQDPGMDLRRHKPKNPWPELPPGGYHVSSFAYPPSLMFKLLSTTEYGDASQIPRDMVEWMTLLQRSPHPWPCHRIHSAGNTLPDAYTKWGYTHRAPWFVQQNPERYWYLHLDDRHAC